MIVSELLLKQCDDRVLFDMLLGCNSLENGVQRSQAKVLVIWNCDSLMGRGISLENDVASPLVYNPIIKFPYKCLRDLASAKVPGKLHATVKTSSRTR